MTSLPAAAPAGPGTGQDNASSPWRPWNGGHRVLQRSGRAEPGHRPEPRSGSAPPGSTGPARHATALALPPPTPGSPVTAADAAADCNDVRSTHQPLPPGPSTTPSPPRQPPSSQWKDYHPTPARSNDTTGPAPTTPTSTHDAAHPTAQHTSRNCCCAHPLNPPTSNRRTSAIRAQERRRGWALPSSPIRLNWRSGVWELVAGSICWVWGGFDTDCSPRGSQSGSTDLEKWKSVEPAGGDRRRGSVQISRDLLSLSPCLRPLPSCSATPRPRR